MSAADFRELLEPISLDIKCLSDCWEIWWLFVDTLFSRQHKIYRKPTHDLRRFKDDFSSLVLTFPQNFLLEPWGKWAKSSSEWPHFALCFYQIPSKWCNNYSQGKKWGSESLSDVHDDELPAWGGLHSEWAATNHHNQLNSIEISTSNFIDNQCMFWVLWSKIFMFSEWKIFHWSWCCSIMMVRWHAWSFIPHHWNSSALVHLR